MQRRRFLQVLGAAGLLPAAGACSAGRHIAEDPIDRRALVDRHAPVVRGVDPFSVLSVGNGRFAFTADATGMQSFPEAYQEIPLATQSEWGWHSFPNPAGFAFHHAITEFETPRGAVPYADQQNSSAGQWLRQNPHRLSLARVGLRLLRPDASPASASDLHEIEQRLDLWNGVIVSRFRTRERGFRVTTCAHPQLDAVAFRIECDGFAPEEGVEIAFPYGSPVHTGDPGDWTEPGRHETHVEESGAGTATWRRVLDADGYWTRAQWSDGSMVRTADHQFHLTPAAGSTRFDLVIGFSPEAPHESLPGVDAVIRESAAHWNGFWMNGGAVDLSDSGDPRATELERRIVLSQYLTAIQCAGSMPPQESGLTFNSWHGKSHLEMHWWHAAHFALWDRLPLLERSLPWYRSILPRARETARLQGYDGARWPKMVGPDGRESPSTIGPFLVWQQPHPIYFAELVYRAYPERAVLDTYQDLVFETAAFMASYPHFDETRGQYVLGPPLIPAQELHPPRTTFNPTFELAYWRWGLETAQRWRERLGLPRDATWQRVLDRLSPLPMRDGLYVNAESDPDTYLDPARRRDHPSLLGAYGFVPGSGVDVEAMRRTLIRVMESWLWDETWGWDYPLVAMTAARLGMPEIAIDALMMDTPKNRYLPNGHNYQREGLTIYLPGNGGLLAAVAMMAAGEVPGFPAVGWGVRWERLRRFV
ncbi:MAG TPA: hypothetical protein VF190_03050 [Rhodothermales bacterium]